MDWKNLSNPLKITSNDGRVNLVLNPVYTQKDGVNLLVIKMKGASVYGFFIGEVILDNGDIIKIKESDKLWGWAEEFSQKW